MKDAKTDAKEASQRQAVEMLCTDRLVPKTRLLRTIDAAVDIYDGAADTHFATISYASAQRLPSEVVDRVLRGY